MINPLPSVVYFCPTIDSKSLLNMYQILHASLQSKVAVKISTGEMGGYNFLDPYLIKDLVNYVYGTIVECNTAYDGKRKISEDHWETIKAHGFNMFKCDILDEFGEMAIPVHGGKHLSTNYIGDHLSKYSSCLVLSHFKGHTMGGFGGAIKNISIGFASSRGKIRIHTHGTTENFKDIFTSDHNSFLESMAEAAKSVIDYMGKENMVYINVANKLSVDCDCDANPAKPRMKDLGIFASYDPVALDKACIDAVYNTEDPGKRYLIERMESRNGMLTLDTAEKLGIGSKEYKLVTI